MNKLYWIGGLHGPDRGCWLQTTTDNSAGGERVIARIEMSEESGRYYLWVSSSEDMGEWELDRTKFADLEDSLTGLDIDSAMRIVEAWCRMVLPIKYRND